MCVRDRPKMKLSAWEGEAFAPLGVLEEQF